MTARVVTLFWLVLIGLSAPLAAQVEPRLTIELSEEETIVGQPLTLRLTILVPTWMPKPPVFPDLEVPSLLVRLPERASGPVSENIDGSTWSGVSRAYRLYPLVTGSFDIPASTIRITYADVETTDPIDVDLKIDAIRFNATLPKEARDLDPPIVAQNFALDQKIEGETELNAGDALTRTVTATIDGTTPILIPLLMQEPEPGPLRSYPKEPVVSETENRGILSGSRQETTTYVAQTGGSTRLPTITFEWYNLDSGKVETATLDGLALEIAEPPAPPLSARDLVRYGLIILGIILVCLVAFRTLTPVLRRAVQRLQARWITSEKYAHRRVLNAFSDQDLNQTTAALAHWHRFYTQSSLHDSNDLTLCLSRIGEAKFSQKKQTDLTPLWASARRAYKIGRAGFIRNKSAANQKVKLPTLNP